MCFLYVFHRCPGDLIRIADSIWLATLATRTIALYSRSRIVFAGVLGFGFLMIAISGVSPPLLHVEYSRLIVHVCKWTLVAGQHKMQFMHGAPGCHYVLSEKSYV